MLTIILTLFVSATEASFLGQRGGRVRRGRRDRGAGAIVFNLTENERVATFEGYGRGRKFKTQQKFRGIPIIGAQLTLDENDDGTETPVFGHYYDPHGIASQIDSIEPTISARTAKLTALEELGVDTEALTERSRQSRPRLMIYIDDDGAASLVWVLKNFNYADRTSTFYIDAQLGQILYSFSKVFSVKACGEGGNAKTGPEQICEVVGTTVWGTDILSVGVLETENVVVYDLHHGTEGYDDKATCTSVGSICEVDDDEINGGYCAACDALAFGTATYDAYKNWLDTAPLDTKLYMRVHYGVGYENAFWDGYSVTFGDGESTYYPLVAADVVAHEVSHGFTEQNSGLIYDVQSGGINEAFSDIAGKAVEYYLRGSHEWSIGADITKGDGALRYFDDPTKDGQSIKHYDDYYDGLDVHYSSGLYNHAVYQLVTNYGWDMKAVFEVFAFANQVYWTEDSSFNEGVCGIWNAANDFDDGKAADVVGAFAVVGLGCVGLEDYYAAAEEVAVKEEEPRDHFGRSKAWTAAGVSVSDTLGAPESKVQVSGLYLYVIGGFIAVMLACIAGLLTFAVCVRPLMAMNLPKADADELV